MHSIKKTTILIFLGVSFGLIAAFTATIHYELTQNTIPLNRSITQKFVDNRTSQINSWFGERLAELRLLASLPTTGEYDRDSFFTETENLVQAAPENYLSIRLVSEKGTSYSANPIIPGFSVRNRSYYQKMLAQDLDYTVSNQLISKEDHQAAVVIFYRLSQPLEDQTAFLSAAVPLKKVRSLAKDLDLYDGTGMLLGADTPAPVIDQDKEILLTSALTYLPDWQVTYIVSKKALGGSTEELLRILQIVMLIVLLLLGLFSLLLFKAILQPIILLRDTMLQVQTGDKQIRVTIDNPKEIAELGTVFNHTLDKVYENEEKYRRASLRVLQEQIQPHFLYNTLNAIQWQVLGGDQQGALAMLENLSTFFRKGLNQGEELTTVADEIAHVRSYLAIQQIRHEELATVAITVDPDLQKEPLLHFLLQPLVENAIDHGIRTKTERSSKLWIEIQKEKNGMEITVANNGTPIPAAQLAALNDPNPATTGKGYGLQNIRQRLQLIYGKEARLQLTSNSAKTQVNIFVPYLTKSEDANGNPITR